MAREWSRHFHVHMFICRRYLLLFTSFLADFCKIQNYGRARFHLTNSRHRYDLLVFTDNRRLSDNFPGTPDIFHLRTIYIFNKTTWRGPSGFHHRNITHTHARTVIYNNCDVNRGGRLTLHPRHSRYSMIFRDYIRTTIVLAPIARDVHRRRKRKPTNSISDSLRASWFDSKIPNTWMSRANQIWLSRDAFLLNATLLNINVALIYIYIKNEHKANIKCEYIV